MAAPRRGVNVALVTAKNASPNGGGKLLAGQRNAVSIRNVCVLRLAIRFQVGVLDSYPNSGSGRMPAGLAGSAVRTAKLR